MGVERLSTTPPPALTWLHLLPSDSKLSGQGLPKWMEGPMQSYSDGQGKPVLVSTDGASDFANSNGGFVAINPRPSALKSQDVRLPYIRRFAVIPNLQRARWFIPLDSPGISSAAF